MLYTWSQYKKILDVNYNLKVKLKKKKHVVGFLVFLPNFLFKTESYSFSITKFMN